MAGAVLPSALEFASDAEDSAIVTHGHFGRSESHAEGLLIWGFFFLGLPGRRLLLQFYWSLQ